jgi:hypothetical protein
VKMLCCVELCCLWNKPRDEPFLFISTIHTG